MRSISLAMALAVLSLAGAAGAGTLDDMISPVSFPTLNEDPRIDTELRPMFLWTQIDDDFLTDGGNYSVLAVQARAALTERLALIATKDGYVFWRPPSPRWPSGSAGASIPTSTWAPPASSR